MAKEIGYTGLQEFSGQIQEEFLRELRGAEGYKRYKEMVYNSPVVAALLTAIENAIRGVTWTWTSEAGEDDPRLELLTMAHDNMSQSWNDHLSEALTMLPFGWAMFEIVYERVDGQMLWHKFAIRGQDTLDSWMFDDSGGIVGMNQLATAPVFKRAFLPIEKCLLYRTRVERNNPEGRSILRPAWVSYYYAKHLMQIEAIGIERDLAGMPMIQLPEGASTNANDTTSDAAIAGKMVRNVRNDEQAGIVLPPGWMFQLLSTGGSRQFDTDKVIQRYESRILMSALAQFLLLGQNSVGSLALSRDQSDFFTMSVNSIADIIGEVQTKYAAPRLLKLNGQDAEGITFEHSPAGDIGLDELGKFLQTVSNQLTWTAQDEAWLRGAARLPELAPEEIEAEKQRKFEQAQQIAAARQPVGNEEREPEENERMGAEYLTAVDRRKWEGRLQNLIAAYFKDQKERLVKYGKSKA